MIVFIRRNPVFRLCPVDSETQPCRMQAYTKLPKVMANAGSDTFVRLSRYTLDLNKISISFNKRTLIFYHYWQDSQEFYEPGMICNLLLYILITITQAPNFWLPAFIAPRAHY